jgi:hypothetical protein
MNWKEIKTNQPTAYAKYLKYPFPVNARPLFDFFDEQGINVFIDWMPDQTGRGIEYLYKILDWECQQGDSGPYPTRREAEEQAFTKAFELLEEKLNRGK